MPLPHQPAIGTIVICDFKGFIQPEMIKRRPAVVISPRFRSRFGLCTVVPFSTTEPESIEKYHHKIEFDDPLPQPYNSPFQWVKADMFCTVSLQRLFFPWQGKKHDGSRNYIIKKVSSEDMAIIKKCMLHAIGMGDLTEHL